MEELFEGDWADYATTAANKKSAVGAANVKCSKQTTKVKAAYSKKARATTQSYTKLVMGLVKKGRARIKSLQGEAREKERLAVHVEIIAQAITVSKTLLNELRKIFSYLDSAFAARMQACDRLRTDELAKRQVGFLASCLRWLCGVAKRCFALCPSSFGSLTRSALRCAAQAAQSKQLDILMRTSGADLLTQAKAHLFDKMTAMGDSKKEMQEKWKVVREQQEKDIVRISVDAKKQLLHTQMNQREWLAARIMVGSAAWRAYEMGRFAFVDVPNRARQLGLTLAIRILTCAPALAHDFARRAERHRSSRGGAGQAWNRSEHGPRWPGCRARGAAQGYACHRGLHTLGYAARCRVRPEGAVATAPGLRCLGVKCARARRISIIDSRSKI